MIFSSFLVVSLATATSSVSPATFLSSSLALALAASFSPTAAFADACSVSTSACSASLAWHARCKSSLRPSTCLSSSLELLRFTATSPSRRCRASVSRVRSTSSLRRVVCSTDRSCSRLASTLLPSRSLLPDTGAELLYEKLVLVLLLTCDCIVSFRAPPFLAPPASSAWASSAAVAASLKRRAIWPLMSRTSCSDLAFVCWALMEASSSSTRAPASAMALLEWSILCAKSSGRRDARLMALSRAPAGVSGPAAEAPQAATASRRDPASALRMESSAWWEVERA
mmetsp:Transcript_10129/g.24982  ORF Transcript_10129/g.24982 Transcript_10129/m.24982 type:complete len:284 (-) Transcript_10129:1071-1922(-)